MMENKKGRKKIVISAVLFPLIAGVMLYLVFRNYDIRTVWKYAAGADMRYIILAVAAMCGFILCESMNIGRVLKSSGYRVGPLQLLTYGAAGFFFSGITPTSSGGQPMQLVYMAHDHIRLSHGSLALLVELTGFQLANISLALLGILYNFRDLSTMSTAIKIIIPVGMSANVLVFSVLLFLIFSERAAACIGRLLIRIFRKLKRESAIEKTNEQLREYRAGAAYIRGHLGIMVKNAVTSFVQLTAMYSISYFVYRALGGESCGWLRIFSLQAMLSAAIAVVPLPGSVGVGEGGFRLIFSRIFTGGLLMPGLLLSRGISLYLGLLITGGFLFVVFLAGKAGKR
jgi:uncharacterized protein (TIRG00374 family)